MTFKYNGHRQVALVVVLSIGGSACSRGIGDDTVNERKPSYIKKDLMTFITESTILHQNATVMAQIAEEAAGTGWRVTVHIARPAGQPPILAGDVDVQLLGEHGPLSVLARPSNIWVEAGGAAGTTASAVFRFGASADAPVLLRISWGGEVVELKIHSSP